MTANKQQIQLVLTLKTQHYEKIKTISLPADGSPQHRMKKVLKTHKKHVFEDKIKIRAKIFANIKDIL